MCSVVEILYHNSTAKALKTSKYLNFTSKAFIPF